MKPLVLKFAAIATGLLILLTLGKYSIYSQNISLEIIIAVFAVVFIGMGYFISRQFQKAPIKIQENGFEIDQKKIEILGISKREYEVLELVAVGMSNGEIAERLFVSESTIKTHVSNLLVKLNVKRRTQAVQTGRELHILK